MCVIAYMRARQTSLAMFAIIPMAPGTLQSHDLADALQALVALSAKRIAIAHQVALAKWDTGEAIEDPIREAMVIARAVEIGRTKGLQPNIVSEFFKAQIEASKIIQYSLLSDWRRGCMVPKHEPIDLANDVRPELDRLQSLLVHQLAQVTSMRTQTNCPAIVAKAVGRYLSNHYRADDNFHTIAIALDRSLTTVCSR